MRSFFSLRLFCFPPSPRLVPPAKQPHSLPRCRHESTARRTTKRLRAPQSPTFLSSLEPLQHQDQDHIVFNPPSSAPSAYHTPPIFLPASDPRRSLFSNLDHESPIDPNQNRSNKRLPPPVRTPYQKTYHLSAAQIEEIRALRRQDPFTWTRAKLAEKYGCSQFFVGMVVQASKERKEQSRQALEAVKARWGKRRRNAREERTKRRAMWGRDE